MTQYETFKIKINSKDIIKKLNKLAEETSNLKPLLRVVRQSLLTYIDDNFDTEGKASGEKWEELSPKYLEQKIKKVKINKILQFGGDLRTSFTSKINDSSLIIGTAKEYAAVHNFGYDERNIPQREFMRFSDAQLGDVLAELEYYYLKNFKYITKG